MRTKITEKSKLTKQNGPVAAGHPKTIHGEYNMTENKKQIPIEELKLYVGTGLRFKYKGHKVRTDPKQPDANPFFETDLTPCVKTGELKVLKFTKDCTYYGVGQSIQNYKSFIGTTGLKPLVRPLSQLTEEIEHNGKMLDATVWWLHEDEVKDDIRNGRIDLKTALELANRHFDLFGWLEKGLAEELKNGK